MRFQQNGVCVLIALAGLFGLLTVNRETGNSSFMDYCHNKTRYSAVNLNTDGKFHNREPRGRYSVNPVTDMHHNMELTTVESINQ